jgi:RNA polymerase sigma-70 factor (ECF subfamily)
LNTTPSSDGLAPDAERLAVDRARLGDQEALGVLYDAYLPRLYRYCLSRVGNETDAEDLAEEIFLKVLGAIETFQWQPTERATGPEGNPAGSNERIPFGAWLFRIAHNHVVSFHRRAATRGPNLELDEGIRDGQRGPEELTETKITVEEVFTAVRELPDAQRDVILLRFASGLSVAETAAALGKNETNVKVLQHKGVQRLKRILAEAVTQQIPTDWTPERRSGPRRLHIR